MHQLLYRGMYRYTTLSNYFRGEAAKEKEQGKVTVRTVGLPVRRTGEMNGLWPS